MTCRRFEICRPVHFDFLPNNNGIQTSYTCSSHATVTLHANTVNWIRERNADFGRAKRIRFYLGNSTTRGRVPIKILEIIGTPYLFGAGPTQRVKVLFLLPLYIYIYIQLSYINIGPTHACGICRPRRRIGFLAQIGHNEQKPPPTINSGK